jgi:hypothetical protein
MATLPILTLASCQFASPAVDLRGFWGLVAGLLFPLQSLRIYVISLEDKSNQEFIDEKNRKTVIDAFFSGS